MLKLHHQPVRLLVTLILVLIVQLFISDASRTYGAYGAYGAKDSAVAWYEGRDGKSTFSLLNRSSSGWFETMLFSSNEPVNSLPVMVVDGNKRSFVVWTIRGYDSVRLAFRIINGNRIIQPNSIKTPLRYAMAPHMAVAPSGIIWLTFSGSNGDDDDDIYVSSWSDGKWTPPLQVNTDDDLPDVLPLIGIDRSGKVCVRWQSFDGHKYCQYYSSWNGKQWGPEQMIKEPDTIYESANARLKAANIEVKEGTHPKSISYFDPEGEIQVWSNIHKQMNRKTW